MEVGKNGTEANASAVVQARALAIVTGKCSSSCCLRLQTTVIQFQTAVASTMFGHLVIYLHPEAQTLCQRRINSFWVAQSLFKIQRCIAFNTMGGCQQSLRGVPGMLGRAGE